MVSRSRRSQVCDVQQLGKVGFSIGVICARRLTAITGAEMSKGRGPSNVGIACKCTTAFRMEQQLIGGAAGYPFSAFVSQPPFWHVHIEDELCNVAAVRNLRDMNALLNQIFAQFAASFVIFMCTLCKPCSKTARDSARSAPAALAA